jgi:hypothetical protein
MPGAECLQSVSYASANVFSTLFVRAELSTDCIVSASNARLVLRQFPEPGEPAARSTITANGTRDALELHGGHLDSGRTIFREEAMRVAVSALNRWRAGSREAERSLSLELAHASLLCPSTALACLYDATARLHVHQGEQRKALRGIVGTLGNCARFPSRVAGLNVSEEWLLRQLTTGSLAAVHFAKVLSFADELSVPLPHELIAPLSWKSCMQIILPRVLSQPESCSAALSLADMCCTGRKKQAAFSASGYDEELRGLMARYHSARMKFCYRDQMLSTYALVLEKIAVPFAVSPAGGLWSNQGLESNLPWTRALWLWSRGHGKMGDECVWQNGVSNILGQTSGVALRIATCECVIAASCATPEGLYMGRPPTSRTGVVEGYVDTLIEQISSVSPALDTLDRGWLIAFARQLPLLSQREHDSLLNGLFPHLVRKGLLCKGDSHGVFGLHLRTHGFLLLLSEARVDDEGDRRSPDIVLGALPSNWEFVLIASSLSVVQCAKYCVEAVSQKGDASASSERLRASCYSWLQLLVQSGLLSAQSPGQDKLREPLLQVAVDFFLAPLEESAVFELLSRAQLSGTISDGAALRLNNAKTN